MVQQYTCPFCFKDYTQFTIQEHYGCGVEPLVKMQVPPIGEIYPAAGIVASKEHKAAQVVLNEDAKIKMDALANPAPKKRGPKPKAKE